MKYVGTVRSLEKKPAKNGNPYAILKVDGETMTTFTPSIVEGLKVGDIVEAEYTATERMGKTYKNLVSAAVQQGAPPQSGAAHVDERGRTINISVVMKAAVDLVGHATNGIGLAALEEDQEKVVSLVKKIAGELYSMYEESGE